MFVPGSVSNLLPFLNMLKKVCLSFCAGFVRQQLTEKEDLLQAALEAKARFYLVLPRSRHLALCIPPLAPPCSGSCRGRAKAIISSYRLSRERPKTEQKSEPMIGCCFFSSSWTRCFEVSIRCLVTSNFWASTQDDKSPSQACRRWVPWDDPALKGRPGQQLQTICLFVQNM